MMNLKELLESQQRSVRDVFGKLEVSIEGNFDCSDNNLTSLEGSPQEIRAIFNCSYNKLTSLNGCPQEIGRSFYCNNNLLTSLEGAPQTVNGSFFCQNNQLTSLEGAPQTVKGYFYCQSNRFTSLKDIHKQIHEINGEFWALNNQIESHVLGLLKIKGLEKVVLDNKQVQDILNKYLGQGNVGLIKAQRELIIADLDDYAEL